MGVYVTRCCFEGGVLRVEIFFSRVFRNILHGDKVCSEIVWFDISNKINYVLQILHLA